MGRGASAVLAVALLLGLAFPAAANAIPSSGAHEAVDMWSSTTQPNASAALGYSARYHSAGDPSADPPPLRRLVIELPMGTRIDTSVPDRCTASDAEIKLFGESACPRSARVGSGQATVRQLGLGVQTYDTVLYNADHDLLELVKSSDEVVGVVHTYVRGTTLDGPIPTCLTGGQPPDGCPFDQLTILANHLEVMPVSVGRRNYGTTPPKCPAGGRWTVRVTFYYADGSVDATTPQAPCTHPAAAAKPGRRVRCAGRQTSHRAARRARPRAHRRRARPGGAHHRLARCGR